MAITDFARKRTGLRGEPKPFQKPSSRNLGWNLRFRLRVLMKLGATEPPRGVQMDEPRNPRLDLHGPPRILVIEDEPLIALLIEEMVREIGYRISNVSHTIAMARKEISKRNFDAVLLDINIGGRNHPELADLMLETGAPFAFVTGYDYLVEPRHEHLPILQKPFTPLQLRTLLEELTGSRSLTGEIAQTAAVQARA